MKTMSRLALPILVLAVALGSATDVRARQRPDEPPPRLDRELAQTVERFMVQRFVVFLELDQTQRETVLPLFREQTQARRTHARQRREAIRTLSAMGLDSGVDEEMLRRRLEDFYKKEEAFRKRELRASEEIRSHLNLRQQARLLAFEERFREEMRRRMQEARGKRPGPRRRPEPID